MANLLGIYLEGIFFISLLGFVLLILLSRLDPEGGFNQRLLRIGKAVLYVLLGLDILASILLLTANIPARAAGYVVGDGRCDYSGKPAAIGLFEHTAAKYYDENNQQLLLIEFEVRPLSDVRDDTLVGEYASNLAWLAYLDRERDSNGWLIKTVILVSSVVFLVLGIWVNGPRTALPNKRFGFKK